MRQPYYIVSCSSTDSHRLPDKVRIRHFFLFLQSVAFFLCDDGFDEESDVATENAHALEALFVLHQVFGGVTVHHVTVAGLADARRGTICL